MTTDDPERRLDVAFPDTPEVRIETITAAIYLPAGQMPWLYVETHDADGTVTRHDVSPQSTGSYVSPTKATYTHWAATHYVRLFSKSPRDQVAAATEVTWSFGRTAAAVGVGGREVLDVRVPGRGGRGDGWHVGQVGST